MHVEELTPTEAAELQQGERFTPSRYPARGYIVSRGVSNPVRSGGRLFIVANQIPGPERDFAGIQTIPLPEEKPKEKTRKRKRKETR